MRSISTDSACIARHRSSASPVTLLYFTPASGLNSNVVTTGPGWICTTEPSTENSRHFSSSSRAASISSRSSTLRSALRRIEKRRRRQRVAAHAPLGEAAGHRLRFGQAEAAERSAAAPRFCTGGGVDTPRPDRPRGSPAPRRHRLRRRRACQRVTDGAGSVRAGRSAAALIASGEAVPFLTCLAITSRRSRSLRRSARRARNRAHEMLSARGRPQ